MLKHIIFFKLVDGLTSAQEQQLYQQFAELLADCQHIAGVISIETSQKHIGLESCADWVLYAKFTDKAALDLYQDHPLHVKVKQLLQNKIAQRQCMDYLVPD